jgi:N-acetylmuramoyl-L-alanine amidase
MAAPFDVWLSDRKIQAVKWCRVSSAVFLLAVLAGCAAPRQAFGPPPEPLLGTRESKPLEPIKPSRLLPRPKTTPMPRQMPRVTVIVDPGHGGRDPGALGVGPMTEEHVNLAVSKELIGQLKARGGRIYTTRSTDHFVSLDARAAMADRIRCDLFVSIHADAASRANVDGATIYIARNARGASVRAAKNIEAAFKRAGIPCRGIRRAGLRVLVGHAQPAVLVECGYLTNRAEAQRLSTSSYQRKIAKAIADGITDHFLATAAK